MTCLIIKWVKKDFISRKLGKTAWTSNFHYNEPKLNCLMYTYKGPVWSFNLDMTHSCMYTVKWLWSSALITSECVVWGIKSQVWSPLWSYCSNWMLMPVMKRPETTKALFFISCELWHNSPPIFLLMSLSFICWSGMLWYETKEGVRRNEQTWWPACIWLSQWEEGWGFIVMDRCIKLCLIEGLLHYLV